MAYHSFQGVGVVFGGSAPASFISVCSITVRLLSTFPMLYYGIKIQNIAKKSNTVEKSK
jgi:hypothetical protein